MTPATKTEEFVNLVALLGETDSSKTVTSISMWIFESQIDSVTNKTVLIDRLSIWQLDDWDLVQTPSAILDMAVSSAAIVENGILTVMSSSDDKDSKIRLSYKYLQAANSTHYRTLQWRSYVGYASTLSISVKNSSSTYNLDCSSLPWAVYESDLVDEEDESAGDQVPDMVDEIEISLSASQSIDGEAHVDWLRQVAPYVSQFTWEDYQDASFNPLIGDFEMMGLSYVEDPPNSGPRGTWSGSTSGHTAQVWSSYSADPGSFSNGGYLDLGHNEQAYDYTTWTISSLTLDNGWPAVYSGTSYYVNCGYGTGLQHSQSFNVPANAIVTQVQMNVGRNLESEFPTGIDNIAWAIMTDNSGVPGSIIRQGTFRATSSTPTWHTVSFSALTANAFYWLRVTGRSYWIDIGPQNDGDGSGVDSGPGEGYWVYSEPVWARGFSDYSGSLKHAWYSGGWQTEQIEMQMKYHWTSQVINPNPSSYGITINWPTGSQALPSNPGTVNHAGATSVWITANSGVFSLDASNVKTWYRRQDTPLSAAFWTDADNDYTDWQLPNGWVFPSYGDEDPSILGEIIYTKGSEWVYDFHGGAAGMTYNAVGNTVTLSDIPYGGPGATVGFDDFYDRAALNMNVDPEIYYDAGWHDQSDGNAPLQTDIRCYVNTDAYESGGDWTVTLWRWYDSAMTQQDSLTLSDAASGYTTQTTLDSAYPADAAIYPQAKYLSKYMAYVMFDGFYMKEAELATWPSENPENNDYNGQGLGWQVNPRAWLYLNWMPEDECEVIWKQDTGGTNQTKTYSVYSNTGDLLVDAYFEFEWTLDASWEGHTLYYVFKTTKFGAKEFNNNSQWFAIDIIDDDTQGPQFTLYLGHPTGGYSSPFLDNSSLWVNSDDEIRIFANIIDTVHQTAGVQMRYRWNDGTWTDWLSMIGGPGDDTYERWVSIQWPAGNVRYSYNLDYEIEAWDDDDSPAYSLLQVNDLYVEDEDYMSPQFSSWDTPPNDPEHAVNAAASFFFSDDNDIDSTSVIVQFSWTSDFSGQVWEITSTNQTLGVYVVNNVLRSVSYEIYSSFYDIGDRGKDLYVRVYAADDDNDRTGVDSAGDWIDDGSHIYLSKHRIIQVGAPDILRVDWSGASDAAMWSFYAYVYDITGIDTGYYTTGANHYWTRLTIPDGLHDSTWMWDEIYDFGNDTYRIRWDNCRALTPGQHDFTLRVQGNDDEFTEITDQLTS
ncbi:MAG: hypothetical protein ACFFER_16140, partial [Candidatus Thorarchaeota archaeon]